jgi:hypothetical protein
MLFLWSYLLNNALFFVTGGIKCCNQVNLKRKGGIRMQKYRLLLLCLLLPILMVPSYAAASLPETMEATPPYAKWGRIAMLETMERYPDASIVDYLHVGRREDNSTSTEQFKLWLHQGDKEFGVFIDITFQKTTEEIISITFEETDR